MSSTPQHAPDVGIDSPILMLGTGRSGTTLALNLLACHPDVAWSSQFTNYFPRLPQLALYARILDIDPVRRRLPSSWRLTPRPSEPYKFLNYVTDGMFTQPRPLLGSEVTPATAKRYRHAVRQHLHWQGKSRFLQKHTGFPRTRYLQAVFPDAKFVHIHRDGRAVANSLVHVGFFDGTMASWAWGPMRPEFEQEYLESDRAPIVLAAIWWKTLVDFIEPAMAELPPDRGTTVRYDALIARPEETMAELAAFSGLDASPTFRRRVQQFHISGSDDKWKRLPEADQRLLEASLGDYLERFGFS